MAPPGQARRWPYRPGELIAASQLSCQFQLKEMDHGTAGGARETELMKTDPNNPEVLTRVPSDIQAAAIVTALAGRGIKASTTGG